MVIAIYIVESVDSICRGSVDMQYMTRVEDVKNVKSVTSIVDLLAPTADTYSEIVGYCRDRRSAKSRKTSYR